VSASQSLQIPKFFSGSFRLGSFGLQTEPVTGS